MNTTPSASSHARPLPRKRYGILKPLRPNGRDRSGNTVWHCRCDCGQEVDVLRGNLISGRTKSCGCREGRLRHGRARTPEYRIWQALKSRVKTSSPRTRRNYRDRRIRVCSGWRDSFESFLADLGLRPSAKHSIERKDNDGHYSCGHCPECRANGWPANCCWATKAEQANNTRKNVRITIGDKSLTLAEWSRATGISPATLRSRVRAGWPESLLFAPPDHGHRIRD